MFKKDKRLKLGSNSKKRGGQYVYDSITGRWKYYRKGTIKDDLKLADFNAEEKRLYREHHELYFQKTTDGSTVPLCVVADVDDIEVFEESSVEIDIKTPAHENVERKRAMTNVTYWAQRCLSQEELRIFEDVCLKKTLSQVQYAKKYGLSRHTLQRKIEAIKTKLLKALNGRKNKKIHSIDS
jgi:predicted DNA-binding protein (UPF0251 family)